MKIVTCTPTRERPSAPFRRSLKAFAKAAAEAGHDCQSVYEIGSPYISNARAIMLRKALDAKADAIVFLDDDVSFRPKDLMAVVEAEGEVIAGTYRFKTDEEEYMGVPLESTSGRVIGRESDSAVRATRVPGGFLRITPHAVDLFMREYPGLVFGPRWSPTPDIFNHGAIDRVWHGEDYAFSRRYCESCGPIYILPDLDLVHHAVQKDGTTIPYPGNYRRYLEKRLRTWREAHPEPAAEA